MREEDEAGNLSSTVEGLRGGGCVGDLRSDRKRARSDLPERRVGEVLGWRKRPLLSPASKLGGTSSRRPGSSEVAACLAAWAGSMRACRLPLSPSFLACRRARILAERPAVAEGPRCCSVITFRERRRASRSTGPARFKRARQTCCAECPCEFRASDSLSSTLDVDRPSFRRPSLRSSSA
jgi:hypothetical protein